VNDEPLVLAHAALFNAEGIPAPRGLSGSFGIEYGPVATQCYQLLLLATTDPVTVAAVHGALTSAVLAAAALWLGRTLRLSPWFLPAALVAPFVVWSNRTLWDATAAVPIGAVALAAYAAYLRGGGRWSLGVALFCTTLVPFCHLQGLPLAGAVFAHAAGRAWRTGWDRRTALVAVLAVLAAVAPNAVYLFNVLKILPLALLTIVAAGHTGTAMPRWRAVIGPFLGGRPFTAEGFEAWTENPALPATPADWAAVASYLIVPVVWLGIVAAGWTWWVGRRTAGTGDARTEAAGTDAADSGAATAAARQGAFAVCLLALGLQVGLFTLMRAPAWPQYFYGTFAVHLLLGWAGVQWLARVRLRLAFVLLFGAAGAALTALALHERHTLGPTRESGPTLANQVEVARALNRYDDPEVWTDVDLYKQHPQAIRSLRVLIPPGPSDGPRAAGKRLVIRYVPGQPEGRARVELVEVPTFAIAPPDAEPVNVDPMSRWY
ncbi:MAG TPA: hypothetical protein VF796_13335, partial [Humisphaera sp.]